MSEIGKGNWPWDGSAHWRKLLSGLPQTSGAGLAAIPILPQNEPLPLARGLLDSVMMTKAQLSRRLFVAGLAAAVPAIARAGRDPLFADAGFRGALDPGDYGIAPNALDPAATAFSRMLADSAARNMPVFLPPGVYRIADIDLPDNVRIAGVAGATKLVYTGEGKFLNAAGTKRLALTDLVIDGGNRWLNDDQPGLLTLRDVADLRIDNCEIRGASKFAIWAERCTGRIADNDISGAAESAIYAVECSDFEIRSNRISDCGNGGILVHRWTKGHDGTIVSDNRIARIAAKGGGTGQNGNGINVFRADDVMISNNHMSDCAFTAVRSNAGSNVQIVNNHCLASGEMAIYSEFGFEGAIISGNLVDGAANGISATNFNEGGRLAIISGNIVRNLHADAPYKEDGQYFGIGISAEADTVVSGNVVENVPLWGLQLGWGPYLRNVNASGNVIRKAPIGCAVSVVEGAGTAMIRDNQFAGISQVAIAGFRWADKSTADLSADGAAIPANLAISGNQVS
jgi:uncharacterized secreted repeat protein (TIGR03808 family)